MQGDLAALEAAIGHSFRDRDLLERALTLKSHAAQSKVRMKAATA